MLDLSHPKVVLLLLLLMMTRCLSMTWNLPVLPVSVNFLLSQSVFPRGKLSTTMSLSYLYEPQERDLISGRIPQFPSVPPTFQTRLARNLEPRDQIQLLMQLISTDPDPGRVPPPNATLPFDLIANWVVSYESVDSLHFS
jgi:hypothetical protein